jgi:hypothetical protein
VSRHPRHPVFTPLYTVQASGGKVKKTP